MSDIKSTVEVSQRIEFSCCYVVSENGIPKLNAHHYKFEATVEGLENYDKTGRVLSFDAFKIICSEVCPDGSFLYDVGEQKQQLIALAFSQYGVPCVGYEFELSAERLLNEISLLLVESLKENYPEVYLKETKLRENVNSYVTWTQEVKENGI